MVDRPALVPGVLGAGRMADPLVALAGENIVIVIDWVLIVGVIALVIAVYWVIGRFIDNLLSFWRAHKEDA
jgi:hypothetical protein